MTAAGITLAGLALVLRLLEATDLQFPRSQIVDYHGQAGADLIAAKWLVPDGFVRAVGADDDEDGTVFAVGHDDEHKRFGFYRAARGWVDVRQAELQCFKPDIAAIFSHLLTVSLTVPRSGIVDLEAGRVWHLGTMRLSRAAPSDVWFARRLGDQDGRQALQAATTKRPAPSPRLVLTTTDAKHLPAETFAKTRIVPLRDVLSLAEPGRIDLPILQARFGGQAVEAVTGPLHLSEDGRVLTINGTTVITFSGAVQIAVIGLLVDAHRTGKRVQAAATLDKAGSLARTFQQAFGKQWEGLQQYLKSNKGLWGFDL